MIDRATGASVQYPATGSWSVVHLERTPLAQAAGRGAIRTPRDIWTGGAGFAREELIDRATGASIHCPVMAARRGANFEPPGLRARSTRPEISRTQKPLLTFVYRWPGPERSKLLWLSYVAVAERTSASYLTAEEPRQPRDASSNNLSFRQFAGRIRTAFFKNVYQGLICRDYDIRLEKIGRKLHIADRSWSNFPKLLRK